MTMQAFDGDITQSLKWLQNNADKIQSLINQKASWYDQRHEQFWTNWEKNVFDLRTANNFGLMVWCIILGVPASNLGLYPNTAAWAFGDQRQNFIASSSSVPNPSAGGNFYGGGQTAVGSIDEIRKLLQLRYVKLVSRGNIAYINYMLKYIFNGNASWDFANKKYVYAMDSTGASASTDPVTGAVVYRTDWQGYQYALSNAARTNLVNWSNNPLAGASFWDPTSASVKYYGKWYGFFGAEIGPLTASASTSNGLMTADASNMSIATGRNAVTFIYKAGTSTGIRAVLRLASGASFGFAGTIGSTLAAVAEASAATVTFIDDAVIDSVAGVRRLRFFVDVATASTTGKVILGPNSTTAGNTIILFGAQVVKDTVPGAFLKTPNNFTSRSTVATYMNQYGSPSAIAGANVDRNRTFWYDSAGALRNVGPLYEPAMTNYYQPNSRPVQVMGVSTNSPIAVYQNFYLSPDGSASMDRYVRTAANQFTTMRSAVFASTTAGLDTFMSFVARAGSSGRYLSVRAVTTLSPDSNARINAVFDLTAGVVTLFSAEGLVTNASATMEKLVNGCWRCIIGGNPGSTTTFQFLYFTPVSNSTDLVTASTAAYGLDIGLWTDKIQVEQLSFPSSLAASSRVWSARNGAAMYTNSDGVLTQAASGVARANSYAYIGQAQLSPIGLLLESAASNYLTKNMDFSGWLTLNSSLVAQSSNFIDGSTVWQKLTDSTTADMHSMYLATAVTAGQQYCLSVYAKASDLGFLGLSLGTSRTVCAAAIFNLFNGNPTNTFSDGTYPLLTYGASPCGNDVWRVWISTQIPSGVSSINSAIWLAQDGTTMPPSYAGTGQGVLICGAQTEDGSVPTSLIYNTTASAPVARVADTWSLSQGSRAADVVANAAVTDYTISDATAGSVTMGEAPLVDATLYWTGSWKGTALTTPQLFGTGDGTTKVFNLTQSAIHGDPTSSAFRIEYRFGASMGLSAQFINLLNDSSMGILPAGAGVKAVAIQET